VFVFEGFSGGIMGKTIALLYATDIEDKKLTLLTARFRSILKMLRKDPSEIAACTDLSTVSMTLAVGKYETLVIGWGAPKPPDWQKWFKTQPKALQVRHIMMFDLNDYRWKLLPQNQDSKAQEVRNSMIARLAAGDLIAMTPPYGFKRKPSKPTSRKNKQALASGFECVRDEMSIVLLIFDLYVNCEKSREMIVHSLNAKGVKPPRNRSKWDTAKIARILSDPVYAGAGRFKNLVRYNVFEPVIDPVLFFSAQAKMHCNRMKFSRQVMDPKMERELDSVTLESTKGKDTHEE